MAKIDLEKWICSMIEEYPYFKEEGKIPIMYEKALQDQGFKYKDGKIVRIEENKSIEKTGKRAPSVVKGYYITNESTIMPYHGDYYKQTYNVFSTYELAKKALALAKISQILTTDARYKRDFSAEYHNPYISCKLYKYVIIPDFPGKGRYIAPLNIPLIIEKTDDCMPCSLLAFKDRETAAMFLNEHRNLIRAYYMLK